MPNPRGGSARAGQRAGRSAAPATPREAPRVSRRLSNFLAAHGLSDSFGTWVYEEYGVK